MDWENIRANKFSDSRPDDWPDDVIGISLKGLNLLGISKRTGNLYWDGREVVVRRVIRFGNLELVIGAFAAAGTFGAFVVEVGRSMGWWH